MRRKLSRAEMIELLRRVIALDGTNEQIDDWIDEVEESSPAPFGFVSGLIYHSQPRGTPEEIVDEALAYKPIIMPAARSNTEDEEER